MVEHYKVPFVLASTAHGPMILSGIDWEPLSKTHVQFGVGLDMLIHGEYDLPMVSMTMGAIEARHRSHGPGVLALDCGANIGVYSMEWARAMEGWGSVIAFEPQERVYYALAGNLALNNLFNVKALNKAVGAAPAIAEILVPDYSTPNQLGAIHMRGGSTLPTAPVEVVSIDSLGINRVDFIKLDIEGMEVDALEGARRTIERNQPFMLVEWHLAGREPVEKFMRSVGYEMAAVGMNMFAGPDGEIMKRFKLLSKETDKYHVGSE